METPELIKRYRNIILESLQSKGMSISELNKGIEMPHSKIELLGEKNGILRISVNYEEFYNNAQKSPSSFKPGRYIAHASVNYLDDGHAFGVIWYFDIWKVEGEYICKGIQYSAKGIKGNPKFAEQAVNVAEMVISSIQGKKELPGLVGLLNNGNSIYKVD